MLEIKSKLLNEGQQKSAVNTNIFEVEGKSDFKEHSLEFRVLEVVTFLLIVTLRSDICCWRIMKQ